MRLPEYITYILSNIENSGYKAFLAGGCVRDCLMGRKPNDWDIATSATPDEITEIFPHTVPTGIKFGTVTVLMDGGSAEVTTFRCDGIYSQRRRPDSVEFVSSLEEDLKRRDFTVNAMAMDKNGCITDLFDGMGDIERRLIKCVGEPERRFSEDALRMFRAIRFSAVLGFELEPDTELALKKCAGLAKSLSGERVRNELEKIIMSDATGKVANVIESGLMAFYGIESVRKEEKERLCRIGLLPKESGLRWTGLCAAICRGENGAKSLLSKLRLNGDTIRGADAGEKLQASMADAGKREIKLMLKENGKSAVMCAAVWSDIISGGHALRLVSDVMESGECLFLGDLAINGRDITELGVCRGKEIGRILDELFLYVLENEENNSREKLQKRALELING